MAEKARKRRIIKPATTARLGTGKNSRATRPRRLKLPINRLAQPRKQRPEYHLPLPDNKMGRFLSKKVRFVPKYFLDAWNELRGVSWLNQRETVRLSFAVFIFAIIFGSMIWLVDYGLDYLLREVLLG